MKPSSHPITPPRYKWLWFFVALAILVHLTFLTVFGLTIYRRISNFWNASISTAESAERWRACLPKLEETLRGHGVRDYEVSENEWGLERRLRGSFPEGNIDMTFENEKGLEQWALKMTLHTDHFLGDLPDDQAFVDMVAALCSTLSSGMFSADFIEEDLTRAVLNAQKNFMSMKWGDASENIGDAETYFGPFFTGYMVVGVKQQSSEHYITRFYITACTGYKQD